MAMRTAPEIHIDSPWLVPFMRLCVSGIIVETLRRLDL